MLAAVILALSSSRAIQAREATEPLRIGYQKSPPYQIIEADGTPGGIAIDILKKAAENQDIELEWVFSPEPPDYHLPQGDVDLWPVVTDLPHRRSQFYISKPIYQNALGILSLQASPISSPSDTASRRIAYYDREPSLTLVPKLMPDAEPMPCANHAEAIRAVLTGKANGAFLWSTKSNSVDFKRILDEYPDIRTYFYTFPEEKLNCGIAAAIDNPQAIDAANRLREELRNLVRNGFVQSVYFKYFLDPENEISSYFFNDNLKREAEQLTTATIVLIVLVIVLAVMAFLLQRSRKRAFAAFEAKSEFLANISHEFRTPLNGIMGMTQLTLQTNIDEQQRHLLETVIESSNALLTIVNDILDISKIEAGKLSIETETLSLSDLMTASTSFFNLIAKQKGLQLIANIHPSCPKYIISDAARLRQILFNLIGNAIKFTNQGQVMITFDSISLSEGDYLLIEISDTGIGIPDHLHDKIFEAFTQADTSTTRHYGGTGLGLTISKQLTHLLKGDIYMESVAGKGSVFSVMVPLQVPDETDLEKQGYSSAQLASAGDSLKILVVDDNKINLRTIEAVIARLDHQVKCVSSGKAAIETLHKERFDIILMDLQMPEMDGWETTRALRLDTNLKSPLPPIIALTASVYSKELKERIRQEMDGLILKPFEIAALQKELLRAYETAKG